MEPVHVPYSLTPEVIAGLFQGFPEDPLNRERASKAGFERALFCPLVGHLIIDSDYAVTPRGTHREQCAQSALPRLSLFNTAGVTSTGLRTVDYYT